MRGLVKNIKKIPLFIVLIIILSAVLRFGTLSKLMVFTPDEEYFLYLAQTLIKHFHIIWIGVSALGFDFYMGPGWVYFIYPFVALAKGDPLVLGIIASSVGVVTCGFVYWFGKKLFNQKVGIIASLIYAASALMVYYDQQPYPTGVPLLSLALGYSLFMASKNKNWWIVFAFLYGIVFHIHLSLILIAFVALYWVITHKKSIDIKTFTLSIVAFLIAISPLLVFDYYHKGSNITAPIRVIQAAAKSTTKLDLPVRLEALGKTLGRVFVLDIGKSSTDEILYPCNFYPGNNSTKVNWLVVLPVVMLVAVFLIKKDSWKDEGKRLIVLMSLSFLIPFVFLPSIGSVEYYLLGFFPLLFIALASAIDSLRGSVKIGALLLLGAFVIGNTVVVFNASGDFGLATKKIMVNKVMSVVKDSPYELSEEGGVCQGTAGWRYLFLAYGRTPERSSEDKVFSWIWPNEVSKKKTSYSVTIIETRASQKEHTGYTTKIVEGGFTAYIYAKR